MPCVERRTRHGCWPWRRSNTWTCIFAMKAWSYRQVCLPVGVCCFASTAEADGQTSGKYIAFMQMWMRRRVRYPDTLSAKPGRTRHPDWWQKVALQCPWWPPPGESHPRHWGLAFLKVAQLANRQLEGLDHEPLLAAPNLTGGWSSRAVTTKEAGKWIRHVFKNVERGSTFTTIHTLKATPLSWSAKWGLDPDVRAILGHHSTGKTYF